MYAHVFEALIALYPEPRHMRTRVRTPGQNGSREVDRNRLAEMAAA